MLDAEAVAIDRTSGKLMPFQELSKRKRKDVKVEDIQVRVCLFAFDLLYLNGEVSVLARCGFSSGPVLIVVRSLYCTETCRDGESSCSSILSPLTLSFNLPSPRTAKRRRTFRHSWTKASRMAVKASWSRCSRAKQATMSRQDAASTGSRLALCSRSFSL